MPREDWWNDPATVDAISQRPRPQSVLFAPSAGYQNPGAALLPDFAPVAPASTAEPPLATRARTQGEVSPAAPPLAGTDMPTSLGGRGPSWDSLRELLGADNGGRRVPIPRIFNEGVEQSPNDAALPVGMFPQGPPPGYRRTFQEGTRAADARPYSAAGPGGSIFAPSRPVASAVPGQFYERIPQGDVLPDGGDARRQGTSLAEIQAANPGWSNARVAEQLQRMQSIAAHGAQQTLNLQQNSRDRSQGLISPQDRHLDAQTAATLSNAAAVTARTNHDISDDRLRDDIVRLIIGQQAGTADDVREGLAAIPPRAAPAPVTPPAGNFPINETPPPPPPTSQLHRTLDQHLRAAAGLPAQAGRGPQIPVALPAATPPGDADKAITNFVHSVSAAGLLNKDTLPEVMAYMVKAFHANHVDRWFGERFGGSSGGLGTPHHTAVQTLQDVMRNRGVPIGNDYSGNGILEFLNRRLW